MICEVFGTEAGKEGEHALFSAEVNSVQMMDTLLLFYKMMGLIPNAETFDVTRVVPNGNVHEYHVPRPLISYGINSYRRWLEKQLPD